MASLIRIQQNAWRPWKIMSNFAIAKYLKGLFDQIERSLFEAIKQVEVPFADPEHSWRDICKKAVLANSPARDPDDFQARNRIRLALADHGDRGPAPSYIYKPLSLDKRQIRLVSLSVAANEFVLENFDWDDAPPCIAISYTWGPSTPSYTIKINGQPFQVRENLRNFLSTAARPNAARRNAGRPNAEDKWLWIDQISIYSYRS
ncbi:hypothetical protein EJ04DRAFT_570684 [Polyplosphaeria fusca]|uniref:Heterokaryon incompatibility domain-containing protein n=1 Tax=Polyplosphaeria fusca TaxID=682080 RepID=A0A9P4QLI0_9PLEO|nr:hypothetical protein EJ04DRAFT_570684 [Polyplosphaeria fusca]